jgi:hypothetical protein
MSKVVLILSEGPDGVTVERRGIWDRGGDAVTAGLAAEQWIRALAARPGLLWNVTPAQTQGQADAAAERLACPVRAVV